MKTGLLLKYNKVHNESLQRLSCKLSKNIKLIWGDLEIFGSYMDLLPYDKVLNFLKSFDNFDFIIIGDVFWDTGQNICRAAKHIGAPIFFMQHGQWIYTVNKKSLKHYPDYTLLFGDNVKNECSSWEYGKHSKLFAVGSPRYDDISLNENYGSYVCFSPPVIEEIVHKKPSGKIRANFLQQLKRMSGIDKSVSMIIQPHYREARTDILRKMFPKAQFADPSMDTMKLIRGSSKVLASRNSTVVLDAIAHRKIVVLTDFPENDTCFFPNNYFGKFTRESRDKNQLIDHLTRKETTERSDYKNRTKQYIRLGNASDRINEIIQKEVYNTI